MTVRNFKLSAAALALAVAMPASATAQVASAQVSSDIIGSELVTQLKDMLANPVVTTAIRARNARTQNISQSEIDEMDLQWRDERESTGSQPTITAALGSPASTFLLRQQASSKGLYHEIFIMDLKGLNVGQSSVTSDYWQGDEAKFQKTVPFGLDAVFIDEPEYNDELGVWLAQVNMTLDDEGEVIGSGTIEINLTELKRRQDLGL